MTFDEHKDKSKIYPLPSCREPLAKQNAAQVQEVPFLALTSIALTEQSELVQQRLALIPNKRMCMRQDHIRKLWLAHLCIIIVIIIIDTGFMVIVQSRRCTSDGGDKGRGWGHAGVPSSSIEVQSLKAVLVARNLAIHLLILPNGVSQVLPAEQPEAQRHVCYRPQRQRVRRVS